MLLLWYTSPSRLSRLIRFVTRSPYSHIAIVVNGHLYEALGGGVRRLDGINVWRRAREAAACAHLDVSPDDRKQVEAVGEAYLNAHYDYPGMVMAGIASRIKPKVVFGGRGRVICSELVTRMIQAAGYLPHSEAQTESPESLRRVFNPQPLRCPQDRWVCDGAD